MFWKKKKIETVKAPLNLMDTIPTPAYPWSPKVITIKKNYFSEKWEDISHLKKKEIDYFLIAQPHWTKQFIYK